MLKIGSSPTKKESRPRKMIYLATYHRKSEFRPPSHKSRSLIFIEAEDKLALDRVIALVKNLTQGDFEESSVEIIGQKAWDTAKIKHPRIKFHKLSGKERGDERP
jgi:hypothetical protein